MSRSPDAGCVAHGVMMTQKDKAALTQLFNQVLERIEAGDGASALEQMCGMLDGVLALRGTLDGVDALYAAHGLSSVIDHAWPLSAKSGTGKPNLSCFYREAVSQSPTASALRHAGKALPFFQSMSDQLQYLRMRLCAAWRLGARIALIGRDFEEWLIPLQANDCSNIRVMGHPADAATERFDLICAPELLHETDPLTLADCFQGLKQSLDGAGTALLASLMPRHIGSGWRELCLRWQPHCHDETGLRRAAEKAGVNLNIYSDSIGCLNWCELYVIDGEAK